MGNCFYIKAQVEAIAERYAIEGANHCSDPLLSDVESGGFPSLGNLDIKPYRHLFGGMGGVESDIESKISNEIGGSSASFFTNMKPKIVKSDAQFKNYVIYSKFTVDLECNVGFPIRLWGNDSLTTMSFTAHAEIPINDTAELIRNTDMVIDYFHGTKLGKGIADAFEKIRGFIDSFAEK